MGHSHPCGIVAGEALDLGRQLVLGGIEGEFVLAEQVAIPGGPVDEHQETVAGKVGEAVRGIQRHVVAAADVEPHLGGDHRRVEIRAFHMRPLDTRQQEADAGQPGAQPPGDGCGGAVDAAMVPADGGGSDGIEHVIGAVARFEAAPPFDAWIDGIGQERDPPPGEAGKHGAGGGHEGPIDVPEFGPDPGQVLDVEQRIDVPLGQANARNQLADLAQGLGRDGVGMPEQDDIGPKGGGHVEQGAVRPPGSDLARPEGRRRAGGVAVAEGQDMMPRPDQPVGELELNPGEPGALGAMGEIGDMKDSECQRGPRRFDAGAP
nr:hypothetical protein [Magnetospirillum sp. UT-4]